MTERLLVPYYRKDAMLRVSANYKILLKCMNALMSECENSGRLNEGLFLSTGHPLNSESSLSFLQFDLFVFEEKGK